MNERMLSMLKPNNSEESNTQTKLIHNYISFLLSFFRLFAFVFGGYGTPFNPRMTSAVAIIILNAHKKRMKSAEKLNPLANAGKWKRSIFYTHTQTHYTTARRQG